MSAESERAEVIDVDSDVGTAEILRKGQGEILKVRFGNEPEYRVIAEHKTSNMGTGWHLTRSWAPDNSNTHLAFLGRVPWKEAERLALHFVALLEGEQVARRRLHEASGEVGTLVAELRGTNDPTRVAR